MKTQPDTRATALRAIRARLGLTREALARQLGVGPESVKSWELGRRSIDTRTLLAVQHLTCGKDSKGVAKCKVSELSIGQYVDLEGDIYADPNHLDENGYLVSDSFHQCDFKYSWEVVDSIERETDECIVVSFQSGTTVGFPPDHMVDVDGEQ